MTKLLLRGRVDVLCASVDACLDYTVPPPRTRRCNTHLEHLNERHAQVQVGGIPKPKRPRKEQADGKDTPAQPPNSCTVGCKAPSKSRARASGLQNSPEVCVGTDRNGFNKAQLDKRER